MPGRVTAHIRSIDHRILAPTTESSTQPPGVHPQPVQRPCTWSCIASPPLPSPAPPPFLSPPRSMIGDMKWLPQTKTLELTERNVAALTDKLDDPRSARMIRDGSGEIIAHAVEDADTTADTAAASEGVVRLTRNQLGQLATVGATVTVAGVTVVAVPDSAHYAARAPGPVVMPGTGEVR